MQGSSRFTSVLQSMKDKIMKSTKIPQHILSSYINNATKMSKVLAAMKIIRTSVPTNVSASSIENSHLGSSVSESSPTPADLQALGWCTCDLRKVCFTFIALLEELVACQIAIRISCATLFKWI